MTVADDTGADQALAALADFGRSIPLNQHLGVDVLELSVGRARTRLAADVRLTNHLGGVHAVAEIAPIELAGAMAGSSACLPLLDRGLVPVVAGLEVRYRAPAVGDLEALAVADADAAAAALAAADAGDPPRMPVDVTLTDAAGTVVATATLRISFVPATTLTD